jgi:hypothetical protein
MRRPQFALKTALGLSMCAAPAWLQAEDGTIGESGLASGAVSAQLTSVAAARPLNRLSASQWLRTANDGSLSGRLEAFGRDSLGIAGVEVVLVQAGEIKQRTVATADGQFRFSNVQPGAYSVITNSTLAFASLPVQVLAHESGRLPEQFQISVIRPVSQAITDLVVGHTLPEASLPASLANLSEDPLGADREQGSNLVYADAGGRLNGNVAQSGMGAGAVDLSGTNVFVVSDGEVVARSSVSANGSFSVPGLDSGVYGLVAVGQGGLVAVSFEFVAGPDVAERAAGDEQFVSANLQIGSPLNLEMGSGLGGLVDPGQIAGDRAGGLFGRGASGGGGGGGGGLLGGGGWLLAAAGAGIAIPLAISGGDDPATPVEPVAPATPE